MRTRITLCSCVSVRVCVKGYMCVLNLRLMFARKLCLVRIAFSQVMPSVLYLALSDFLVQVTLGKGFPSAEQRTDAAPPSSKTTLSVATTTSGPSVHVTKKQPKREKIYNSINLQSIYKIFSFHK